MKLAVRKTVIHNDGTATVTLLLDSPSFVYSASSVEVEVVLQRNRAQSRIWGPCGDCPEAWLDARLVDEVDEGRMTYDEILSLAVMACEEVDSWYD